jgi:hypothetical protein
MAGADRSARGSPEPYVKELDLPIVLIEHVPARSSGRGLHCTEDVEEMLGQVVQTGRLRSTGPERDVDRDRPSQRMLIDCTQMVHQVTLGLG